MKLKDKDKVMPLYKLEKYVLEWLYAGKVSYSPTIDQTGDMLYVISDNHHQMIYVARIKKDDLANRDKVMVSTGGILDEELRGCVEQCIAIDLELERNRELSEKNASERLQQIVHYQKNS